MASLEEEEVVRDGDEVIVRKDESLNLFTIKAKKQFWIDKTKFSFQGALDKPYGTKFNLINHDLVVAPDEDNDEDGECGSGDNRNLQDAGLANQKLSSEDIEAMRKEGIAGQDIVERLVENSETFDSKSEFSKEKYLKKKKKKYQPIFTILRPNYRLLFEYVQRRAKSKLSWIREDGLAQILCQGNVRHGGRYLVVDGVEGLLTGGVLYRMGAAHDTDSSNQAGGDIGRVIEIFSGNQPTRMPGLFNKSSYHERVYSVPVNRVDELRYAALGARALPSSTRRRDPPRSAADDGSVDVTGDQTVTSSVLAQPALRFTDFSHPSDSDTKPKFRCTPCDPGCYTKRHKSQIGHDHVTSEHARMQGGHHKDDDHEQEEHDEPDESGKRKASSPSEAGETTSWKQKKFEQAVQYLSNNKMDGILVASKSYPLPLVMDLVDFLAPSRQVVVYCPYEEPLMMCYKAMKESGRFVNINLTETWFRDYQILPNRTHPHINMSGGGGFLLKATSVEKA